MPELPDLEYIVKHLQHTFIGTTIRRVEIQNPLVFRVSTGQAAEKSLEGQKIEKIVRHGHFLHFALSSVQLVMNLMLTGRLQKATVSDKPLSYRCFSLYFDGNLVLHYGDKKQMGKIYVLKEITEKAVPGYTSLGVDILSPDFSFDYFKNKINAKRTQARVFIMDKTIISSVGNAYADEILFAAKIHPQTPCNILNQHRMRTLYESIIQVMRWGIHEVEKAAQPIETKVRDHVKVRNRKNQPCPECGTLIRRTTVHGYDTFFCPRCQPSVIKSAIPW